MNRKELEEKVLYLETQLKFYEDAMCKQTEQIKEVSNRLEHSIKKETLRDFMKERESETTLFEVEIEDHTYKAKNCKDFEKFYGKKLLDNTIVVKDVEDF